MSDITKVCSTNPLTNILDYSIVEGYESSIDTEEELLTFYNDVHRARSYLIDFENILREFKSRYLPVCSKDDDFALKFVIEYMINLKLTTDSMYDELNVDNDEALIEYCVEEMESRSCSGGIGDKYLHLYENVIKPRAIETLMFLYNKVDKHLNTYLNSNRVYLYCGYISNISNKKGSNIIMFKEF